MLAMCGEAGVWMEAKRAQACVIAADAWQMDNAPGVPETSVTTSVS